MATIAQAAAHLCLDERRFRELVDAGTISKSARGAYDLDRVREQYIRNLREVAAGRVSMGELDPAQERARKDKEYADHLAMRNDLVRGDAVLSSEVGKIVAGEYSIVRTRVLAMPNLMAGRCFGKSHNEIQAILSAEAHHILAELSDPEDMAGKAKVH